MMNFTKKLSGFLFLMITFHLPSANLFADVITVNGSVSLGYTDLTSAFNAINNGDHGNGDISVLINQSHTLSSTASLNGGVFNSCLIKPTADVTIDEGFGGVLILLDGADRVTIDGRIGIVNTIKLNLASTNDCIKMNNGASDNVIKFIQFNLLSFYQFNIDISQSIPGSGGNNNTSIEDCNIPGFIYSAGTPGATGYTNDGIKILRNHCKDIYLGTETRDVDIKNNKIERGILLRSVGTNNITQNILGGMYINATNLTAPGSNITEINIVNNFICGYTIPACGGTHCFFDISALNIEFYSSPADITVNIFYNSITLNGHTEGFTTEGFLSWGLHFGGASAGNFNIKNNLVVNSFGPGSAGLDQNSTGSLIDVGPSCNVDADYNCYFCTYLPSAQSGHAQWNTANTTNINDYRAAAFPNEQHSIFKLPELADITACNLHLSGSSIGDNDLKGIQISGITNDIDNQSRLSPYRGADEVPDFPLPVELVSFTSFVNRNNINLNWTTSTEINNSGFEIQRSIVNDQWSIINFVDGNGNTNSPQNYSYEDRNLTSGKYKYRLKQIDYNGDFDYFNLSNEVIVGAPEKYELSQNYPNPFNPVTKITFELPIENYVTIKVFNTLGKEVSTLINEMKEAGIYSLEFNGSNLSSGVYYYSIKAGTFESVKRMALIK